MKHVHVATAGAAGATIGLLVGVGSAAVLTDESEPTERIVQAPASADLPDQPEEPDALVQWLKQHPRSR